MGSFFQISLLTFDQPTQRRTVRTLRWHKSLQVTPSWMSKNWKKMRNILKINQKSNWSRNFVTVRIFDCINLMFFFTFSSSHELKNDVFKKFPDPKNFLFMHVVLLVYLVFPFTVHFRTKTSGYLNEIF